MSESANGQRERSVDRRSAVSGESHRKRGLSSRSRERDRQRRSHGSHREGREASQRDRERDRDHDYDRHRERSGRDDPDRERHRHRDRERERERERERGRHGDSDYSRHRDREDRDRKERRRAREGESEDGHHERSKRRREDVERRSYEASPHGHPGRGSDGKPPRDEYSPRGRAPSGQPADNRERSPDLDDPLDRPMRRPNTPPAVPRASPTYEPPSTIDVEPDHHEDDSEARSVFVSQLAARLTARDLGYFFEDKLGDGAVRDCRIVTDRISRRSKGIAYVEFKSMDLVPKAIALSGTVVMGLPIMIQLTEAERNRTHAADAAAAGVRSTTRGAMQLYVGSLHFNLTESDIRQVFEPFGDLDFVDLHRDPLTGRSKGYAFVQYKRPDDAKMALEQMEGFELAGRALRVNTVHEKGNVVKLQQDSLEENGGANLNAASRQALMQKLARTNELDSRQAEIMRPSIPTAMTTRCVLLRNMFDPEEETGADWDKELAEDVKKECEGQYGSVVSLKVERESAGEIYIKFETVQQAAKAVAALNGRYFGGKQVSAAHISDAIMQAHQ